LFAHLTGCSVHTRGVLEHKRFLLLWQDNSCFTEASLDDRQAAEEIKFKRSGMDKPVKIAPPKGKLGVLLPGMGAVSTTFMAGVELVRKGKRSRWAR